MMRISEALCALTQYLQQHGIEDAATDAEWFLAAVCRCKRLELFLDLQRPLSMEQIDTLRSWSVRRAKREPLQYILETVEFFGKTLQVDSRVLIPRPETEELVYQVRQFLKENHLSPEKGLDLGTGSGAIAIMLTSFFPILQMVAVDRSKDALEVAKSNAKRHSMEERIQFVQSNWFDKISGRFDFIVSNPPYLSEEELKTAQPEVRDFEPREALQADENGLLDLKQILLQAPQFLKPGGWLVMEMGCQQASALQEMASTCGYIKTQTTLDLSGQKRYFWGKIA